MSRYADDIPPKALEYLESITAKRAKTVIRHILDHGSITTKELADQYGYKHAPRAVRDVRELGIPIVTERVNIDGQSIARYRFGDFSEMGSLSKSKGRQRISDALKSKLIERYGAFDYIYLVSADVGELQVDHRIPYEIAGECDIDDINQYMLLTASSNRLKSHACENCSNWLERDVEKCKRCFWAFPEDYDHVACREERILILELTTGAAIEKWDAMRQMLGETEARNRIEDAIANGL